MARTMPLTSPLMSLDDDLIDMRSHAQVLVDDVVVGPKVGGGAW